MIKQEEIVVKSLNGPVAKLSPTAKRDL